MQNNTILELEAVHYVINKKELIKNISFNVESGDMISIIGPNGAGKSTLIKLITGELKPSSGNIFLNKTNLKNWDTMELANIRAVLPQTNNLSFPFTVLDIVKMGRHPIKGSSGKNNNIICEEIIDIFDLNKHIHQNYITLSGGEKQRVQLARAFAQIWSSSTYKEKLLIIDEPTSFLDINHQCALFDFLKKMNKKGLTIIMVLHDLNQAFTNSNKVIMLKNAKLIEYQDIKKIKSDKLEDVFDVQIDFIENKKIEGNLILYSKK